MAHSPLQTVGSRAQVWHGTAKKTAGDLTRSQLMKNKHGRIVSRRLHNKAKREKRLIRAGFFTRKGTFGFVKRDVSARKTHRRRPHRKH